METQSCVQSIFESIEWIFLYLVWNASRHVILNFWSPATSENEILSLLDLRQNTTKMSDGDFFTAGIIGYVCMSMVVRTTYMETFSIWQGIQLGKRTKTICHFWFSLTSFDHVWKNKRIFIFCKGVNKTKQDLISKWKDKH